MAKTINPDIDIFDNEAAAKKAFQKSKVSCHLLYVESQKDYFIDRSRTALNEWPNLYKLIEEK
jgi:hypothetical protein